MPDDFTISMGFPGRNWRYMISDEVEERMNTTNFMRGKVRGVRQNVMLAEMQRDPAVRIQYASKFASSANYWKNAIGMNKGLIKLNVLNTKKEQQSQLLEYGRQSGDNSYQDAFDKIREIVAKRFDVVYHQQAIYEALMLGTEFSRIPATEKLAAELKQKADKSSIQTILELIRQKGYTFFNKDYNPEVDRKISKEMLKLYKELIPKEQRISIFEYIDQKYKGDTDAFIDECFDKSIFSSPEKLEKFLAKPSLKKLTKDPMVLYSNSVRKGYDDTNTAMRQETDDYNSAHKTWVKGMMELKRSQNIPLYPDANSTLRLTYGRILPYKPGDAVEYSYMTTLGGVMEKEDPDNYEFIVPSKLKELYDKKDFGNYAMSNGEMPICFITNTDNTGGNSGSPVLNSKGHLIGTAFDRNWEGLTGDIAFQPVLQRAICVDIRYILFIIDKFAGANHLIDEMTIITN